MKQKNGGWGGVGFRLTQSDWPGAGWRLAGEGTGGSSAQVVRGGAGRSKAAGAQPGRWQPLHGYCAQQLPLDMPAAVHFGGLALAPRPVAGHLCLHLHVI